MLTNLLLALIKINVTASIVAVITLIFKFILKKLGASRKLLFCLWIVIGLRFVCPDFITSKFSFFNLYQSNLNVSTQQEVQSNNELVELEKIDDNIEIPVVNTDIDSNKETFPIIIPTTDETNNSEILQNDSDVFIPSQEVKKEIKLKTTDFIMIAWIITSISMILYAIVSYTKLKRSVMFAEGKGEYYETDMISSPCVIGIIKPKIYLMPNISEENRKYILIHENVHIKRKDYISKIIAYLILSIHVFNPLCFILFKLFVDDMEMLCDEESIKKMNKENKVRYMESLVNLSIRNTRDILPCPIAFSENNTEKRVKNMIKYKRSGIIVSILALVLCIVIAGMFLTNGDGSVDVNSDNIVDEYAEKLYEYNNAYLGDAVKMRELVSLIKLDSNIVVSNIELYTGNIAGIGTYLDKISGDTDANESENMGIKINLNVLSGNMQVNIDELQSHARIFLSLVKNADYVFYNYTYENSERYGEYQVNRETFLEDLNEYTKDYNTFKNFIETEAHEAYRKGKRLALQAFGEVLKDFHDNFEFPDGTYEEVMDEENYNMSDNRFAIADIDMDGDNELILSLTHYPMAAMRAIIYEYDHSSRMVKEKFTGFTSMTFYDNGVITVDCSHNQGYAGDSLWPYTIYKYDKTKDTYILVAGVDAWDKSFTNGSDVNKDFPQDIDKDGDGIIYYIIPEENYKEKYAVDFNEYNDWRNQYINESTKKLEIDYIPLTKENIDVAIKNYEYIKVLEDKKVTEINIEGQNEEISYVGVKSNLGYTIQYDKEAFELFKQGEKDYYENRLDAIKDKVYFTVEYVEKKYDTLKNENKDSKENMINGRKSFCLTYIDNILISEDGTMNLPNITFDSDVKKLYYIDVTVGVLLIEVQYPYEASEGWGTRISQMINTIEIFDGLIYSTKGAILLRDANDEDTKKVLDEIARQDYSFYREHYEKIPDTAIKNTDDMFNTMIMNSGRYFEKVDEEESYKRKISNEEAIKIASKEVGLESSEQVPEKVTAEFVLYTNLIQKIEKKPIILVTLDGFTFGGTGSFRRNPRKINQTQAYIDAYTGERLELVSRGYN